jgi:hypothetical protein
LTITDDVTLKIKINSLKINRDFIAQLIRKFEEEKAKIPQDKIYQLSYRLYLENCDEVEPKTSEKFREQIQDKSVIGFRIYLTSRHKDITLWIKESIRECEISTKNYDDDTWAPGVKSQLENLFKKYKTIGGMLSAPINLGISLLLASLIAYSFIIIYSQTMNRIIDDDLILTGVIVGGNTIIGFYHLINWLFPKIETEYMNRVKHRMKILGGMATLIILPILRDIIMTFLLR